MKQRANLRSPLFVQHTSREAEPAGTNYYLRSQELTNSPNGGTNVNKNTNFAVAPDGTTTAERISSSTNTSTSKFHVQNVTLSTIGTYTYSAYIRSYGERFFSLLAARNSSPFTSWGSVKFDLVNGRIQSNTVGEASIEYFNNGWYRVSVVGTTVNSGSQLFRIALDNSAPEWSGILAWGVQVEEGALSSYIASSSSVGTRVPVIFADESRVTNDLRIWNGDTYYTYDRTNVAKENNQLTNSYYAKTNTTATETNTLAPDGSFSADRLTSSTNTSTAKYVQQISTLTETGSHTLSVHVKSDGVDVVDLLFFLNSSPFTVWGSAKFDLSSESVVSASTGTARIQKLENGWYRLSVSGNASASGNTGVRVRITDDAAINSGVYLWGWQVETGTSETSVIPTFSNAVTVRAYEDDAPANATYSISSDPIDGLATFEISQLIKDYIDQTRVVNSGTVWAKVLLSDGLQIPKEYTFLCTEGYISSYEPIQTHLNTPKEEALMQSNKVVIIPEDESLNVPVYAQWNSYYTVTDSTGTSDPIYFSNLGSDSTQIEYLPLSSDDTSIKLYVDSVLIDTVTVSKAECSKYDNTSLMFVNKFGAKQEFFVNMKSIEKIKVKDSGFNRNVINYSTLSIGDGVHGYTRNVSESKEMFTLNTPFLDEGNSQAFEELLLSEYVWISRGGSDYSPVVVKDSSMTRKTHLNDKLIQYTINVESSFNLINNQR